MIRIIKLWILGAAAGVSAGWILSLFHAVNLAGYVGFGAASAFGLVIIYRERQRKGREEADEWPRWRPRRFRRPLPLLFLLTSTLALVGGATHAPNNYDALTYRFPRMLHWWAASGWHWIITPNERMNLSGTAFEWLTMPLFIVTHSDRCFFLLNIAAYLLLPSLIFLIFIACGVSRRVAWFWMWLLPAALCYAMQAGSISNDTIASTFFLSAIFFALHAQRTRAVRYLWLSFLAAGLLSGVKASNLPLMLPIAWAMWPALGLIRKRIAGSLAIACLGALVSFLPSAVLNQYHSGDWAGDPQNTEKNKVQKPLAGVLGNSLQLGLQSLEPPFLPLARSAEIWVWDRFPAGLQNTLKKDFPRFGLGFRELPQEESAGLGIGITLMILISVGAAWRLRHRPQAGPSSPAQRRGIIIGALTWIALFVYMSKLGSEATSRLIAAYYPLLLLPFLLNPAQDILVRRRWYRGLGLATAAVSLTAVILTPSRPLWPAETFFRWAAAEFPESSLLARAKGGYGAYRARNDLMAGLRQNIPASVLVVGLIEGSDDAETSLWRPYGHRRVVHVFPDDRVQMARLHWLVVKDAVIESANPAGFEQWVKSGGGKLVASQPVVEKAGAGPEMWSVVYFPDRLN